MKPSTNAAERGRDAEEPRVTIMGCLICESERARPVWRQGKLRIDECQGCGVLFTADRPTEEEMMRLYAGGELIGERPDPLARRDELQPAWKMTEHAQLLDRLAQRGMKSGTLLDVGCFSGVFLSNAKKRGFDCIGLEPNEDACLHVRNAQGLEVINGSLESAHIGAERFSVVSLLDVIEHVPDPLSELGETFRILRPGGWLILTTPNVKGLPQRVVKGQRWLTGRPFCPIDDVPWHLWGFTRSSLARCVEKAGFAVQEIIWLEPSPLSTHEGAGSSRWKRMGLRFVAKLSKWLGMAIAWRSWRRNLPGFDLGNTRWHLCNQR
jgi:SAM-dependent methyltransferase